MPAAQPHDDLRANDGKAAEIEEVTQQPVFSFIFACFIIHGALMSSELIEGLRD